MLNIWYFFNLVVDFTIIDEHARETPRLETATIKGLSHYLTSVWDHPLYKLRAIFAWVTDNISYDCEAFYSGIVATRLFFKISQFKSFKGNYLGRKAGISNLITWIYKVDYVQELTIRH